MKLKKIATLLLAAVMTVSTAACGNKENSKSSDDVELSVSIWDSNQEPGIKEILADFTEETGIKTKVSVVKWDEYWTMLEAGPP